MLVHSLGVAFVTMKNRNYSAPLMIDFDWHLRNFVPL